MSAFEKLQSRLRDGEVIVMDGGTGTEIGRRGVALGAETWSAESLVTSPGTVREVHEDYIRAGAEILITNTFDTGQATLDRGGLGERTVELNRLAVKLAQDACENVVADRPVVVAGSMSSFVPKGDPTVTPSYEAAFADYDEQSRILAEAGVDLILLEMMTRTVDIGAAVDAAVATGLPVWLGLSVIARSGELYLGLRSKWGRERVAEAVDAAGLDRVSAIFIMHTPIEDTAVGLRELRRHVSVPVGAYAHAVGKGASPDLRGVSPEDYLEHAMEWVGLGAQIVGGCCHTTPDHVSALSQGLPRSRP